MAALDKDKKLMILKKLNLEIGVDKNNIILAKNRIEQQQKELFGNNTKVVEAKHIAGELESTLAQIESIQGQFSNFKQEYEKQEIKLKPISSKMQDNIDKINQLEQAKVYMSILQWVEDINEKLKIEIQNPHGLELYQRLCAVALQLSTSQCKHLYEFVFETCLFWFKLLKDKYSPEFEASMLNIKWPFTSSNTSATQRLPSHEVLLKFKKKLKTMLLVQYPLKLNKLASSLSSTISFPQPTLAISLLLKPLQKRFFFHFAGSKQTNRIDKPEWFLTLILGWIKDHQHFIDTHIQPVFTEMGQGNAKAQFMRGLIQVCVQKLQADMSNLISDDLLFSHTVDEVLGFEKELRDIYGYPSSEPSILQVFTQSSVLTLWIELEGKLARDKMDEMFESETAWSECHASNKEIKLYECPELFTLLLTTMTERYELLPTVDARCQFLELQLSLLDEYRLRLTQVMHESDKLLVRILNTAHYLHFTINEWTGTLHFILLQQQCNRCVGLGSTVFDDILSLLDKMIRDLGETVLKTAQHAVTSKARRYCNDNWVAKDSVDEGSLTSSACLMFKELSKQLLTLHADLADSLFTSVWENLATQLSHFLFENVILANKFSRAGGKQLRIDVTRNLLPLFSQYTAHPERYFNRLIEACHLLSVDQVPKNPLIGLKFLSKEDCFRVLRNRNDMNIRVNIHDLE